MISPTNRIRIAALCSMSLAACSDITSPTALPEQGPPADLQFATSAYGGTSTRITLRGDTVVVRRAAWDAGPGDPVYNARVVPTAAAWRAFWVSAERAGVERWREKYEAKGVADGGGYSLRIVGGGGTIESLGINLYPDSEGRGQSSETEAYLTFVSALNALAELQAER